MARRCGRPQPTAATSRRSTSSSWSPPPSVPSGDYRDFALTPQAIISQDERQVTAYSPTTGEQMRDRAIESSGYSSDEDADVAPGTYFARGAMGVLANSPTWTKWAVGRDVPLSTSTFYDLATGDQIGRVAARDQQSISAEGADQVYLVASKDRCGRHPAA